MRKFFIYFVGSLLLTGCSSTLSLDGNPRLGMKFQQPYSSMFGGGTHAGLDIDVPTNTPVKSIADGYVRIARSYDIRGMPTNIVMIDHANGISSRYLHISKLTITPGEQVKQGQVFAHTAMNGPSGPFTNQTVSYPHLHLEIYRYTDQINPESLNMTCNNATYIWPVGCK